MSDRLISFADLYRALSTFTDEFTYFTVIDTINDLPTVDAEPVVRCKDCIHYYADPWGYGNCVFEGGVSRRTKESDFCSWGERKEDG